MARRPWQLQRQVRGQGRRQREGPPRGTASAEKWRCTMISIRSGFDPDKIIAKDQEQREQERRAVEAAERTRKIEERKGKKKGTAAAPASPPVPSVVAPY